MKIDDIKLNLVCGPLIDGEVGDALGYTVEFNQYSENIAKYNQQVSEY